MFYSHEILNNPQHGVSTIWLVATVGPKARTCKVSRKAIQEVNVRKACQTIQKPGAPIALRLQGSLLYGVSRVYSQQCTYVLTDAEKVQARMRAFWGSLTNGAQLLDPAASKPKNDQLIENDPNFHIELVLPPLPPLLLEGDDDRDASETQKSRKTSSQLSPMIDDISLELSLGSAGQIGRGMNGPASAKDTPTGLHQLQDPFSQNPSDLSGLLVLGEELDGQLNMMDDLGFEIDENGNLIEKQKDTAPEAPLVGGFGDAPVSAQPAEAAHIPRLDEDVFMNLGNSPVQMEQVMNEDIAAIAPAQRQRRPLLAPDLETKVTSEEFRSWSRNYVTNQEVARERAKKTASRVTPTEAKKQAWDTLFGVGIMSIGKLAAYSNYDHPLAQVFAGDGLEKALLNMVLNRPNDHGKDGKGKKGRTSSEALEDDEEEIARKSRRRLNEAEEEGRRGQEQAERHMKEQEGDLIIFNQDEPERGRDRKTFAGDPGSDFLPWNRSSILLAGSSAVRNLKGKQLEEPSPLSHRLSAYSAVERYSDRDTPVPGVDNLLGNKSYLDKSFGESFEIVAGRDMQVMRAALDIHGQNFLGYVEATMQQQGELRMSAAGKSAVWISFDALLVEGKEKAEVAAQAFYQVLGLATKNFIKVEQDGQGGNVAYGDIRIGLKADRVATAPGPARDADGDVKMTSSPPPEDDNPLDRLKRMYQELQDEAEEDEEDEDDNAEEVD